MITNFSKWLIFSSYIVTTISSCGSSNIGPKSKTLRTIVGKGPAGKAYMHDVLLDGFSKSDLDSATAVSIALRYIDTVKIDKPIDLVCFYSSDRDFNFDEVSQDMDKIDKSCLVKI